MHYVFHNILPIELQKEALFSVMNLVFKILVLPFLFWLLQKYYWIILLLDSDTATAPETIYLQAGIL